MQIEDVIKNYIEKYYKDFSKVDIEFIIKKIKERQFT